LFVFFFRAPRGKRKYLIANTMLPQANEPVMQATEQVLNSDDWQEPSIEI
jgi:hypothetical protein